MLQHRHMGFPCSVWGGDEELVKYSSVHTQVCPIGVSVELIRHCHMCTQRSPAQSQFGQQLKEVGKLRMQQQPCPHQPSPCRPEDKEACKYQASLPGTACTRSKLPKSSSIHSTETTFSRLGAIAFASNSGTTQKVKQNGETEEYTPNEETRKNPGKTLMK